MLAQFFVNGIITGVLYSLMALGFAVVYNTTHIFHIAAAGIYVVAAFIFWAISNLLHVPILLSSIVSIVLTMFISLLSERLVYWPLEQRKASHNAQMIASIGIMTILINVSAIAFGNEFKVIDGSLQQVFHIWNMVLTFPQILQLCIGGGILIGVFIFLHVSNMGRKIRAISDNCTLYSVLGGNICRLRTLTFLLSGLLIGVTSCLTVYDSGLNPNIGMTVFVNAVVAFIIGGIGRFGSCIVGGLTLGILQAMTSYMISSDWQSAVTFFILLLFLFIRPNGIDGIVNRKV